MEIKDAEEPILGCTRAGNFSSNPEESPVITHKDYSALDEDGTKYSTGHMTPISIVADT